MSKRNWRDSGLEALGVSKFLLRDLEVLEGINDDLRDIDEAIDLAADFREAEASLDVDAHVGDLDAFIEDTDATISAAEVLAPRGALDIADLGTALDRVNTGLDMTGLGTTLGSPCSRLSRTRASDRYLFPPRSRLLPNRRGSCPGSRPSSRVWRGLQT